MRFARTASGRRERAASEALRTSNGHFITPSVSSALEGLLSLNPVLTFSHHRRTQALWDRVDNVSMAASFRTQFAVHANPRIARCAPSVACLFTAGDLGIESTDRCASKSVRPECYRERAPVAVRTASSERMANLRRDNARFS